MNLLKLWTSFKSACHKISVNDKNLFSFACGIWLGIIVLAVLSGQNFFKGIHLFQFSGLYSPGQYLIEFVLFLLGHVVLFILPGLAWLHAYTKRPLKLSRILTYSFLISLGFLFLTISVYKLFTPFDLKWFNFIPMPIITTFFGIMFVNGMGRTFQFELPCQRSHVMIASLLILLTLLIGWIYQDKVLWVSFDTNFSEEHVLNIPLGRQDDTFENFGLVDSLRRHILPFWDLEYVNRFGYAVIDPPLHMFTSFFLVMFFDQSFAIQSLNSLFVIVLTFMLIGHIATHDINKGKSPLTLWAIPFLYISFVSVFIPHYDSVTMLQDLIHFVCFFTLLEYYFLLKKDYGMFLIFALLAFYSKYESVFFTLLGLFFYQSIFKPDRGVVRDLFKKYVFGIIPYIFIMFMIGLVRGDLSAYVEAFVVERFMRLDYADLLPRLYPGESTAVWASFSWASTGGFIKQVCLGTTGLILFIFLPQKDKTNRFYQWITLVYLALILICRIKRIHYICPLVYFSAIVALRTVNLYINRSRKESLHGV